MRILKLHGSLNWLARGRERRPDYLLELVQSEHDRGPGFLCMRLDPEGPVLRPVFVPPRERKDYEEYGLGHLWVHAEQALAETDRLVVVGYSMPKTDVAGSELLQLAAHRNLQQIDFVTLGDSPATPRFRAIFPSARVYTSGFEQFARAATQHVATQVVEDVTSGIPRWVEATQSTDHMNQGLQPLGSTPAEDDRVCHRFQGPWPRSDEWCEAFLGAMPQTLTHQVDLETGGVITITARKDETVDTLRSYIAAMIAQASERA